MSMAPLGKTLRSMLISDPEPAAQPSAGKPNWAGILADALAGAMGKPGAYAGMMQQQRAAEQEEAQWTRRQQSELGQYEQKKRVDQRFDTPKRVEQQDNAGNVWVKDPTTGQWAIDFIDRTPKQFVHDGMQISVPNPYAPSQPATAAPAGPPPGLTFTPIPEGGPALKAPATFQRR